jgi:hypothetical protein
MGRPGETPHELQAASGLGQCPLFMECRLMRTGRGARWFEKCGPELAARPGAAVPQKDVGGLARVRILAEAYAAALSYLAIAGLYDEWVAGEEGDGGIIGDAVPLVGRAICQSREFASLGPWPMEDASRARLRPSRVL